jgi:hypothetical protein
MVGAMPADWKYTAANSIDTWHRRCDFDVIGVTLQCCFDRGCAIAPTETGAPIFCTRSS